MDRGVVRDPIARGRPAGNYVALIDELLIGKVRDEHLFRMRAFADVVKLNRRGSIRELALTILKRFELWLTWISLERVRISAKTHRAHFLEKRFFTRSDDQGRGFRPVRADGRSGEHTAENPTHTYI